MGEESTFAYVLRLIKRESFEKFTPQEEKVIDEHFGYLKKKLEEGKLILAGPCLDGELGIVIFRASLRKEAEAFVENSSRKERGYDRGTTSFPCLTY